MKMMVFEAKGPHVIAKVILTEGESQATVKAFGPKEVMNYLKEKADRVIDLAWSLAERKGANRDRQDPLDMYLYMWALPRAMVELGENYYNLLQLPL